MFKAILGIAQSMVIGFVRTSRLLLQPVSWSDIADIARLKADGGAFGQMLGGVRNRQQTESDMADDITFWARYRVGMFTIRENNRFIGITGVHVRPDKRGIGLRFALFPWARGRGLAREAANAALNAAHEAGITRIVGVTPENNYPSRVILRSIGMSLCEKFIRDGQRIEVYESLR